MLLTGESLLILGYDPENADDLKAFVELEVAKENAVRAYSLFIFLYSLEINE